MMVYNIKITVFVLVVIDISAEGESGKETAGVVYGRLLTGELIWQPAVLCLIGSRIPFSYPLE